MFLSSEFLEAIPDAMVAVDHDGTILQVNSQTETLFGYRREELIGQRVEILVPARLRAGHRQHRDAYAEAPRVRRMGAGLDLKGRRRDGSEFDVEISLSPVRVETGTLVLSAIRDVTDRKRIEQELRRVNQELTLRTTEEIGAYRARLAAIIDSSEDAIIAKDLDGTITAWNQGAERMYGYTPEEMIGQNISRLSESPEEIPKIMARIKRGERITHHEAVRVTKDGRRLQVSVSISPLRNPAGEIVGASAIARDISEQKRAEEHLRQAQKMEAVGRLAGGLAHDFNNILGIVNACTELLQSRIERVPGSAPYLGNIRKAVERGTSLTRQLLAFTRRSTLQVQLLDLNQHLPDVRKLIRPLMGDDVEVVVRPHCETAVIEMDPGQLDQILLNLAVNARDAMPKGGKFLLETSLIQTDEVFMAQHPPMKAGKYVVLAVSDTGSGMDPGTLSRIFEPFFTTKEVGKGTGLGLATVYAIVQQMSGYIWVYSEVGSGTTFKLYLPNAEDKIGETAQPEDESVPRREGVTVLLVEDDEIMLSLTRQLLEENGYHVLGAKDADAALETMRTHRGKIDLLLTDVVMRGTSGPELVERVSASHPAVKAVFMSGYTGELLAQHRELNREVPLLEKPFSRAALWKVLDAALG
jgi:PAS domain S-box-containing protein